MPVEDFNSYGSRRGNDRVMMRGTFANVRIKNLMVPGVEGGVTIHQPDGEQMSIYDAVDALPGGRHAAAWCSPGRSTAPAAPATGRPRAPGCSACARSIAQSFERIHRSNLVGMGVLPVPVQGGRQRPDARAGRHGDVRPHRARLTAFGRGRTSPWSIHRANGETEEVPVHAAHRHADRGRSTTGTAASCRTCCGNWRNSSSPPRAGRRTAPGSNRAVYAAQLARSVSSGPGRAVAGARLRGHAAVHAAAVRPLAGRGADDGAAG